MEEHQKTGLICDHPLLEKLDPIDRIVVASHYANLLRGALANAEAVAYLKIINLITLVVATNTSVNNEQKAALAALVPTLKDYCDKAMNRYKEEEE